MPAEMALQLRSVGEGVTLIAGASGFTADARLAANDAFELVQDVPDRGGFAAAQVVDFGRRRIDEIVNTELQFIAASQAFCTCGVRW